MLLLSSKVYCIWMVQQWPGCWQKPANTGNSYKNRLPSYIPNMHLAVLSKVRQTCVEMGMNGSKIQHLGMWFGMWLFWGEENQRPSKLRKSLLSIPYLPESIYLYRGPVPVGELLLEVTIYSRKNYIHGNMNTRLPNICLLFLTFCESSSSTLKSQTHSFYLGQDDYLEVSDFHKTLICMKFGFLL